MLEQEIASIIKFTLDKAGNPSPYYHEIPEGFVIPAVYFPPPEVTTKGYMLSAYAIEYTWFIKFFSHGSTEAYELGFPVLKAIMDNRKRIPLINSDGEHTGRGFRLKNPSLRSISGSFDVAQLTLSWDSPRPYIDPKAQKMMSYDVGIYSHNAYCDAARQMQQAD